MEVAENNYRNVGEFFKTTNETLLKVLMALIAFLETEAKYGPQKEFAKWIRQNGSCCFYNTQGKCINDLIRELDEKQIPYLRLSNNEDKIIIKTPDLEKVKDINRMILIGRTNYYQEVDALEMENAIASIDKINNKELLTLHNLDFYETEVIKNKCNDISKGFMVGISQEEDNENLNSISITTERLLTDDPEKKDFCKSYLQAMHSLYGPNHDTKVEEIKDDIRINNMIANLRGTNDSKFVAGADEKNFKHYIELNSTGFIAYSVGKGKDNEDLIERVVGRCDIDDPNYDSELQRYLAEIKNKVVLNNSTELSMHLTGSGKYDSKRTQKTRDQELISKHEDEACDLIDKMIKERLGDSFGQMDPTEKFEAYAGEVIAIIDGAINGVECPYPKKEVENLKAIYDQTNATSSYKTVMEKIEEYKKEMNIEHHNARKIPEKVLKEAIKEARRENENTNR